MRSLFRLAVVLLQAWQPTSNMFDLKSRLLLLNQRMLRVWLLRCAKNRVVLPQVGLFADGVAVKQIGKNTFEVLKDACDEVITVTTDEICAAVKDVFDDVRSVNEPAGALAVAGLKKYAEREGAGDALVAILSGANVNFDRIRHVAERAEVGEKREQSWPSPYPSDREPLRLSVSRSVTVT